MRSWTNLIMRNLILMASFVVLVSSYLAIDVWEKPRGLNATVRNIRMSGGVLPQRDLAEIRRLIRLEIWRDTLPTLTWWSIRRLLTTIPERWNQRIYSMEVKADGAVLVDTEAEGFQYVPGERRFYINGTFELRRQRGKWQILRRVDWEDCQG